MQCTAAAENLFAHRLEVIEMCFYRRLVRISWTEHGDNEEVSLRKTETKMSLILETRKRQLTFLGHVRIKRAWRI